MKDHESFVSEDIEVRNMLLTVLSFVNWVRPCGLYNLTIEEWDGQMMSREENCVVVKVSNHKKGAQFQFGVQFHLSMHIHILKILQ